MNSYIITYDLIKRKNYPELIEAIKYFSWWHCLGSVWIIKTNSTASQIYGHLRPHIDNDDKLIVIRLLREAAWTESFPKNCQDWLQNNL